MKARGFTEELLISTGRVDVRVKMVRFRARIAANSRAIGKIRNAEVDHFELTATVHKLIRGFLSLS